MKSKTIIFVHPFTSVEFSLARTKQRGYKIITIRTPFDKVWIEAQWAEIVKFTDFIIESHGNVEDDLATIKRLEVTNGLDICAVINSLDGSIFYGDSLANHLLGFQINLEDSKRRTNKFVVNERLRETGHSFIRSIFVGSMSDFEQKSAEIRQFTLPIVIKPASNSAARHDVKILHSFEVLRKQWTLYYQRATYSVAVRRRSL